eukprot:c14832_g1_i3.p1 GENE.c14832_g1_i3~~c14832_g1_i3.p1  ORF type:complete len:118 (+),score=17.16 c14832_g1_i3:38-391(+)
MIYWSSFPHQTDCYCYGQSNTDSQVPVLVCASLFKLCPLFPATHPASSTPTLANPSYALPNHQNNGDASSIAVMNPVCDYVPPELVRLLITSIGSFNTAYIYRLLADLYSEADYDLA